jgi:hypothetical protein
VRHPRRTRTRRSTGPTPERPTFAPNVNHPWCVSGRPSARWRKSGPPVGVLLRASMWSRPRGDPEVVRYPIGSQIAARRREANGDPGAAARGALARARDHEGSGFAGLRRSHGSCPRVADWPPGFAWCILPPFVWCVRLRERRLRGSHPPGPAPRRGFGCAGVAAFPPAVVAGSSTIAPTVELPQQSSIAALPQQAAGLPWHSPRPFLNGVKCRARWAQPLATRSLARHRRRES